MPTEQIYEQLAAASSPEEVKSILADSKAKIVYASGTVGAPPDGPPSGGASPAAGDEPESDAEAAVPGEEVAEEDAGPLASYRKAKKGAISKAMSGPVGKLPRGGDIA